MTMNRLPTILGALLFICATAIADQDLQAPAHVTVCLSKSNEVTVTLQRPSGCASKELVVVTHGRRMRAAEAGEREVLHWHPPCSTTVAQEYRDRVRVTCDPKLCQLQLQLSDVTVEDQGLLVCRNGAMGGPQLVKCGAGLRVVDAADLQQSCSYSPTDRTVRCDKVTTEVKVYRKGEWNDRDVRYFSAPFHFRMGDSEEGEYEITQVTKTEEDALCSGDFEFHVEKRVSKSSDLFSGEMVTGLVCILALFLFVPLAGIDIITEIWKKLRPGQERPGSERERPQAESGSGGEEESESTL